MQSHLENWLVVDKILCCLLIYAIIAPALTVKKSEEYNLTIWNILRGGLIIIVNSHALVPDILDALTQVSRTKCIAINFILILCWGSIFNWWCLIFFIEKSSEGLLLGQRKIFWNSKALCLELTGRSENCFLSDCQMLHSQFLCTQDPATALVSACWEIWHLQSTWLSPLIRMEHLEFWPYCFWDGKCVQLFLSFYSCCEHHLQRNLISTRKIEDGLLNMVSQILQHKIFTIIIKNTMNKTANKISWISCHY